MQKRYKQPQTWLASSKPYTLSLDFNRHSPILLAIALVTLLHSSYFILDRLSTHDGPDTIQLPMGYRPCCTRGCKPGLHGQLGQVYGHGILISVEYPAMEPRYPPLRHDVHCTRPESADRNRWPLPAETHQLEGRAPCFPPH